MHGSVFRSSTLAGTGGTFGCPGPARYQGAERPAVGIGATPSGTGPVPAPVRRGGARAAGSVWTRPANRPAAPGTCPYPVGSSAHEVWNWLAYRGESPTTDLVCRELAARLPPAEPAPAPRPARRSEVAARLASRGPALAAYVEAHWAAHSAGPTGPEAAEALRWPGDGVDHQRALDALTTVGWVPRSSGESCGRGSGGPGATAPCSGPGPTPLAEHAPHRLLGLRSFSARSDVSCVRALSRAGVAVRPTRWSAARRTDLTAASSAGQPVEQGPQVIVRLATIGADGPTGTFHEDDTQLGCQTGSRGPLCRARASALVTG